MPVKTLGIDVSRYQTPMNMQTAKAAGAKFVVIRATVGDYYVDPEFYHLYDQARIADLLVGAYAVIAPADGSSTNRKISATQHINRIVQVIGNRRLDFPIVLDCELARGQSNAYITSVIQGCVRMMPTHLTKGIGPIIYTRQSWWDYYVLPWSGWAALPLWAARYGIGNLSSPWADGYYRFRDWTTWKMWQWSADENRRGREFGAYSASIDLDYFNGSLYDLYTFCGVTTASSPSPSPSGPTISTSTSVSYSPSPSSSASPSLPNSQPHHVTFPVIMKDVESNK